MRKGHKWIGRGSDTFAVAAIAIPNFWLGLLLVLLFTGVLNWLPPTGYVGILANPLGNLRDMVMPILTLVCAQVAVMLRTTRGSMEGVLGSPYILFHRAKGLQERSIVYHHALRNASGPIITIVGIEFGTLLGGAIVIENLFGLPGVGQLVVSAISARDYVVVQGGVFTIAALFIIVNLVTDIAYGLLNRPPARPWRDDHRHLFGGEEGHCDYHPTEGEAGPPGYPLGYGYRVGSRFAGRVRRVYRSAQPGCHRPPRRFASPSLSHLFGGDDFGRDTFSRVLYSYRVSLGIAAGSVLLACLVGIPIGLAAGYIGTWVDMTLMRVVDLLLAFPALCWPSRSSPYSRRARGIGGNSRHLYTDHGA